MQESESAKVSPPGPYGQWKFTNSGAPPQVGGNASVFQVEGQDPGLFALKLLRSDLHPADKAKKRLERFLREIELCKAAEKHGIDGVVRIVDSDVASQSPWYVMPWACGGTLELGMAPVEAVEAVLDVARVLSRLREVGIAHRDIKPSNILRFGSEIVVADLGLALDEGEGSDLTGSNEHIGSMGYRAPEAIGHIDFDPFAADVYSLGKTLWALIAGQRLDETVIDDGSSLSAQGIDLDDNGVLDSLLIRYTQRDASKRPSVNGIIADLAAWLREPSLPAESIEEANRRLHVTFARESRENALANERVAAVTAIRSRLGNSIEKHFKSTFDGLKYSLRAGNWRSPQGWVASRESESPVWDGWQHTACWVATGTLSDEIVNIRLGVATRHGSDAELTVHLHWFLEHPASESTFDVMGDTVVYGRTYQPALDACIDEIVRWIEDPDRVVELNSGLARLRSRARTIRSAEHVTVRVLNHPKDVEVYAVLKSGLAVQIDLDESGAHSRQIQAGQLSRLWISHPDRAAVVKLAGQIPAEVVLSSGARSVQMGKVGRIPELAGSFSPLLDNQDRMYAHLTNLSVRGSADNPYTFELGIPFVLTDTNGVLVEVTVVDITRQRALINYVPLPVPD